MCNLLFDLRSDHTLFLAQWMTTILDEYLLKLDALVEISENFIAVRASLLTNH